MLRVLACQIDIPRVGDPGDRDAHMARVERLVSQRLGSARADLVVLPELSTVEYSRRSFERLGELAEDLDGPSCTAMTRVARTFGCHVVFGMPRKSEAGGYCISQLVAAPDGEAMQVYDKIHLAQLGASMEKEFFEPGEQLCVFDCAGVTMAPIICYDVRFPELARTLARRHRVELILHCGAYYRDPSYYSWHHFAVTRAMENQVWVLSLNRAGGDFGGSVLCPPWADEKSPEQVFGDREELRLLEIDRSRIAAVRAQYPFLNDSRSDYDRLPLRQPERRYSTANI